MSFLFFAALLVSHLGLFLSHSAPRVSSLKRAQHQHHHHHSTITDIVDHDPVQLALADLQDHEDEDCPPTKRARMQHSPGNTTTATCAAATQPTRAVVAQRLKKSAQLLQRQQGLNNTAPLSPPQHQQQQKPLSELDQNTLRLIAQYLKSLGMHASVDNLIEESGCPLEKQAAAKFRCHVLAGNWDLALSDVHELAPFVTRSEHLRQMRIIILEQKYLELIDKGKTLEALGVLRDQLVSEMTPNEPGRVEELSALLMVNNGDELRTRASWAGPGNEARAALLERLRSLLPPSIMLPPKRLEHLLKQAWQWQVSRCPMHNSTADRISPDSLLLDHHCGRHLLPSTTKQVLNDHVDEVWSVAFSPCGRYLATGAKENCVYIWQMDPVKCTVSRWKDLEGAEGGAAFIAWSADSRYLAVAGNEDSSAEILLFQVETGQVKRRISHTPDDSLSVVAWQKNGEKVLCGGQRGHFYQYNVDDERIESWEGFRIRGIYCKKDGRTVLASDTHNRIRAYTFDDMRDWTVITEQTSLIYFTVDSAEQYALCTTKDQGLHLWDLNSRSLLRTLVGSKHVDYVILSCFGGTDDNFVATGSEDACIYIWNRSGERPIAVLEGHTAVVNAVSWNPANPEVLASCSDDGTVRIWTSSSNAST